MRKSVLPAMAVLLLVSGAFAPSAAVAPGIELLNTLASPDFEGRGVGTAGLDKARDLIQTRLAGAGLLPAFPGREGQPASYLQELRVFIGNDLLPGNAFFGRGDPSFIPLAFSRSGAIENAGLVFVGFGISLRPQAGRPDYDDYAGLDVKGKIVVAMTGDPGTGNPSSFFRDSSLHSYSTPIYKVQNAELHGAAGIVLVRDPLSLSGQGGEPALRFQPRQGGGAATGVLAGQISRVFAETLLGRDLRALQERIASTQRPASFAVDARGGMRVALDRRMGAVQNVAGLVPGTDPALAREFLVVGAHYDHLGYGGDHSHDPDGIGHAHPGADDNASGVQAAVSLAERVRRAGGGRRPLLVVLFTAEESGLLGSQHFVENPPLPEGARIVGMINLDMIGRLERNKLNVIDAGSALELPGLVERANREAGFFDLAMASSSFGSSDQASFLRKKIPAVFFTTGAHRDYHRPSDTAEKINAQGVARVEELTFALWRAIDSAAAPLTYDPASETPEQPPREGRGYGAYFGSVPEFEQGAHEGVLLQGARPGSPAEEAGLRAGDVLNGIGEIRVRSLQDLVFALRFYRPNDEIVVRWMRGGQAMSAKAVLRDRSSGSR